MDGYDGYDGVSVSPRQRRLLWEVVTMVDLDTLNDNLARVREEETADWERDELARALDPDGAFQREWSEGPRAGL